MSSSASPLSPQAALIYVMVIVSAADSEMTDRELYTIGEIVKTLPIFEDFDREKLVSTASACAELLSNEDGLDRVFDVVEAALPVRLRETAYALACDVAASDGKAGQEELRLLEMIRHRLSVERLSAAAIERGARARYARV
ncbi:tellurite resistance TerB family protein [Futiania mangrovi]|uniref:Tellurite resistance TerB family protein n=1 Tax=Futiania mangrovi TaxID=2959716 RepID=A0A9J6PEL4_9PROT|nr:tellurite resistance TerB family protein [Futiania mangrovii]MCP1336211.1 tellurite resistance TerB family protein [Futiania mangrovii]